MAPVLVIGYGNRMRGDDGLGPEAAMRLMHRTHGSDVAVLVCHQLTPELAESVAGAELVIFIDASCEGSPGSISCVAIDVDSTLPAPGPISHQVDPAALIVMADRLFGHRPRAVLLSAAAQSFDFGEKLSHVAEIAIEELIERAEQLIEDHSNAANIGLRGII